MDPVIRSIRSGVRRFVAPVALLLVLGTLAGRVRDVVLGRPSNGGAVRGALPSLFERLPDATRAPRRAIGLRSVAIEDIVGTMRHPSQNTADFLPLPRLRGENWRARWQRISRATDRLEMLPPVDLVQVGEEFYVADGHNRVAAARRAGAVEIDADITQLILPGITQPGQARLDAGSLIGAETVRRAGAGRVSRTVEQRASEDLVTRADLARDPAASAADATDAADGESDPGDAPEASA